MPRAGKQRQVGNTYRPIVTILKLKKGEPTVIEMSGNRYILSNEPDFSKKRPGGK